MESANVTAGRGPSIKINSYSRRKLPLLRRKNEKTLTHESTAKRFFDLGARKQIGPIDERTSMRNERFENPENGRHGRRISTHPFT